MTLIRGGPRRFSDSAVLSMDEMKAAGCSWSVIAAYFGLKEGSDARRLHAQRIARARRFAVWSRVPIPRGAATR